MSTHIDNTGPLKISANQEKQSIMLTGYEGKMPKIVHVPAKDVLAFIEQVNAGSKDVGVYTHGNNVRITYCKNSDRIQVFLAISNVGDKRTEPGDFAIVDIPKENVQ